MSDSPVYSYIHTLYANIQFPACSSVCHDNGVVAAISLPIRSRNDCCNMQDIPCIPELILSRTNQNLVCDI